MLLTWGPNWPPWLKNITLLTPGPNRPFRCLDVLFEECVSFAPQRPPPPQVWKGEAEESVECGCFSFAPFDTSKGNLDDFSLLSVLFAWVLLFYSFTNMVPTRSWWPVNAWWRHRSSRLTRPPAAWDRALLLNCSRRWRWWWWWWRWWWLALRRCPRIHAMKIMISITLIRWRSI